jgi:hypothetical protein
VFAESGKKTVLFIRSWKAGKMYMPGKILGLIDNAGMAMK